MPETSSAAQTIRSSPPVLTPTHPASDPNGVFSSSSPATSTPSSSCSLTPTASTATGSRAALASRHSADVSAQRLSETAGRSTLPTHSRSLSHPVNRTAIPIPVPVSPPLGPSSGTLFPASRSISLSNQSIPTSGFSEHPAPIVPLTPTRPAVPRGLSLQLPSRNQPLPPCLDPALGFFAVRRPRLDFTRSCTSLHHSFIADSPDSSPLTPSMPIPRRGLDSPIAMYHSGAGLMLSSMLADSRVQSDDSSDSSSDDDDEMELSSAHSQFGPSLPTSSTHDIFNSSALLNRRHMTRLRGRGSSRHSSSSASASASSTSLASPSPTTPPNGEAKKAAAVVPPGGYFGSQLSDMLAQRRQSISQAMKKIGFLGGAAAAGDDGEETEAAAGHADAIRRPVTRRGSLLPKPKHFQRVRAALIEEAAPVDTEMRIEAAIQRQLREDDEEQDTRTVPQTPVLQPQAEEEHPLVFDDGEDEPGTLSFKSAAQRNSGYWGSLESSSPGGFIGFRMNPDGDIIMGTDSMVNSPISRSPEVRKLKRRRDDEELQFDQPWIIKRRAVSPGFSQSPTVSSSPVAIPANAGGGITAAAMGSGAGPSGTRSKRSSYIQDAHDGLSKMSISPFL